MKSGTRRQQPWLKDFIVFLFLMSFQNSHAVANTPLSLRTSQATLDLRQQPIPPVTPAKNLNDDKIPLSGILFNVAGDEADRHVFHLPCLHLAALTTPYFRGGSIKTLDEAVKLMAKYQLGRKISDRGIKYIVTFLKKLPGEDKGLPLMAGHSSQKQDKAP